ILTAAEKDVGIGQPEAARQERALPRRKPILRGSRVVAEHKAISHEFALDRFDRAPHPRVFRRQETDRGDEQRACIQVLRSIGLDERAEGRIKRLLAHLRVNLSAQVAPMVERPIEAESLDSLDRAVESDPRHHFRISEMLAPSAHFPDALVWQGPYLLEMGQK